MPPQGDALAVAGLFKAVGCLASVRQHNMPADPVRVMGKIRPEGQGHPVNGHLPAEVYLQPCVLPCADAPALEGPLAMGGVGPQPVDHVAGGEAAFAPGFHIGNAVGEEIGVAPQVGGVAGDIAPRGDLLPRHCPGGYQVPWAAEGPGAVGQAMLALRHAPGHAAHGQIDLAGQERGVRLHHEVVRIGLNHNGVTGFIHPVNAQERIAFMGGRGQHGAGRVQNGNGNHRPSLSGVGGNYCISLRTAGGISSGLSSPSAA